jgi:hypothetical protein
MVKKAAQTTRLIIMLKKINNNFLKNVRCNDAVPAWHISFLCFLAACYLLIYFAHPALPGNNSEYPLGWWGWFDQGEYLKEAKAITRLDLAPGNYFYPPLYPLLGSVFVNVNPMHVFALINIVCFLAFAHFFIQFSRRYFGWGASVGIFLLSFYPGNTLFEIWVEPWTTTVVAPIYAFLFWDLDRYVADKRTPGALRLGIWGALGGLIFATRPADAVAIGPFYIFVFWYAYRCSIYQQKINFIRQYAHRMLVMIFSGLIGVIFFLVFNLIIHGSIGGRYFSVSTQANGFHILDVVEKAVSVFLDAGPLYGVPEDAIFSKMKWLALFVPAAIYGLLLGSGIVRIIILVAISQLIIYLPYSDLLPTGIWKYHNIHYFKWLFPFAAFVIVWTINDFLRKNSSVARGRVILLASVVAGILLLCTRIDLVDVKLQSLSAGVNRQELRLILNLPSEELALVDKVSFPTLHGSYEAIYFGQNKVRVDGRELNHIRDFRFLPAKEGVDLLFIRPIKARMIEVEMSKLSLDDSPIEAHPLKYNFKLGSPGWLGLENRKEQQSIKNSLEPQYGASLDQGIDFKKQGYPRFLSEVRGISDSEPWGRWSNTGLDGKVTLSFIKPLPENFILELVANAYGPNIGKRVKVIIGGIEKSFTIQEGDRDRVYSLTFEGIGNSNTIEIIVPNPVRPKDIVTGNTDSRMLGLAFVSLKILDKK